MGEPFVQHENEGLSEGEQRLGRCWVMRARSIGTLKDAVLRDDFIRSVKCKEIGGNAFLPYN